METVIRLLDELDDFVVSTAFRLLRVFTWTPRERRRRPRLNGRLPVNATQQAATA
ncbi:MAG: hypothetical protein V2I25_08195 [Woeseiaceae bacterium]|jgi:hypothetical protein|nr:hypothetical protein [Woeseiaceae bacterium]